MNGFVAIDVPRVEGISVELIPPNTLKLVGTMTRKEPSTDLAGFFRLLHADAVHRHVAVFWVDVCGLTFVNSSSIRLFIDWAAWVKAEAGHRYVLAFRTSRHVTWQTTAFSALTSLMKECVTVERV
ncbi:MAG: hypothetical protein ACRENE_06230 [Polyangiaceae bacterium]